jgi:hypothetical protein
MYEVDGDAGLVRVSAFRHVPETGALVPTEVPKA